MSMFESQNKMKLSNLVIVVTIPLVVSIVTVLIMSQYIESSPASTQVEDNQVEDNQVEEQPLFVDESFQERQQRTAEINDEIREVNAALDELYLQEDDFEERGEEVPQDLLDTIDELEERQAELEEMD